MIIFSCKMKKTVKALPGKIAIEDIMKHTCSIYEDSDTARITFTIRNGQNGYYSGFSWLNTKDLFVGSEHVPGEESSDYKANISVFNLQGNMIERLYEAKAGEFAGLTHPSRNDKYLLFASEKKGDASKEPFEGLKRMNSIIIMDLPKKQVIQSIKDVGTIPAFEIDESPWLFDETAFVYSYKKDEDPLHGSVPEQGSSGIYICNIGTGQRKLLIADAHFAICSPTDLKIAYIKDRALRILDLKTNNDTVIYKAAKNERVRNIHWIPDGKSIYLASFHDYPLGFFSFGEKLIDVGTGESVPFKKIDFGLFAYSWK
jgi:WD40 repeat protein